jgi:hypothetical protein
LETRARTIPGKSAQSCPSTLPPSECPTNDGVAQIQLLDYLGEISCESTRAHWIRAECGRSVSAQVDANHTKPVREVEVLVVPGSVIEREAVHQNRAGPFTSFDDV